MRNAFNYYAAKVQFFFEVCKYFGNKYCIFIVFKSTKPTAGTLGGERREVRGEEVRG